jgi:hypothetical protein
MSRRRSSLQAIAAWLLTIPAAARAGDYAYDLPQLVGHYLGDMPAAPVYELAVDLSTPFAEINGATLRLEGAHTPGIYGYLSHSSDTFPAPAEAIAWLPQQSFSHAYADEMLPLPGGAFDLSMPWRGRNPGPTAPDLAAWLDGTAEFNFQISGPILIAITYQLAPPDVTINSATLIIHGQPALDMFMLPGDFNGDRLVNDADLATWQATSGDGSEFLTWQRNVGAAAPAPTVGAAVPEPGVVTILASLAALTFPRHRRRHLARPAT